VTQRKDDIDEPAGADYETLARLARATRPVAPPDFADRVMRAVAVEAARPRRSFWDRIRDVLSIRPVLSPRLAGAMAVAALGLVIASVVLRPGSPDRNGGTEPDVVLHRFEFTAPEAREVCLVGDFNGWELCRMPLRRDPATGRWALDVPLPPGRHEYMFVVDDENWVTDPAAPARVDDGFGNQNAVVFL
jgi:hypothetical protein